MSSVRLCDFIKTILNPILGWLFAALSGLLAIGFVATAPLWTQNYDLSSLPYLGGIAFLAILAAILIFVFLNILAIPFWQSLKAVIYYDLRSHKEGIGLELRDAEFK
jgi:hypothetical protein